ncbi:alpha/beta fold hydrolase [Actinacidiphila bryophytorum]|uniref:Pimeloyl-ACP methyl ester carboxylesterase n=1 Tax=Actinacidiphila bryophytorum TaxID=1436133 RepID=A0A9W4H0J7_9ACTN|nr:alpha/beta hydrolase [Actinacidiphila bryophytorum]MBM9438755.1 alpha/beta hydrolase [Actinacidiphila bryophytorum]MBN6541889.1 alpha/beta hydrolase [Actinacidiphila bryophytorum]CAG7637947.1 Pimeloyl-ACP methyl ester carboxylesterase [Actinacidiphila bryophytorum]
MTLPYEAVPPRRTLQVVSADGTHIHVEEFGRADGPAVVLAHGWTCSVLFWAPVVRLLASDFRVIAYDQRGHGRSAAPRTRTGHGTGVLADDLEAVLQAVLPEGERAVLAGHSMGGMTIMAASGRAAVQRRTAAVLLASTGSGRLLGTTEVLPPRFSSRRLRRFFHRQLLTSRLPLGPVTPLSRAAFAYGVLGVAPTREQAAFTARIVHACKAKQRAAWGRVLAVLDLDEEIAALAAPTAVLVGTRDKLTPRVHARGMAEVLPHCVGLTELSGLGHMTPIEDPAAVAAVIRELNAVHALPQSGVDADGSAAADQGGPVAEEKSA